MSTAKCCQRTVSTTYGLYNFINNKLPHDVSFNIPEVDEAKGTYYMLFQLVTIHIIYSC